jgi:hypothetical protein
MPRYSLRTLLILLGIGPPLLAGVWTACHEYLARMELERLAVQCGAPSIYGSVTPAWIHQEDEEFTLGIEIPEP